MDKKVLAVGDVILDRYVCGTADRLSPEAVVPVLRVTNEYLAAGGAGHVAAVAAAQGVPAGAVWAAGRTDLFSTQVADLLTRAGVWHRQVPAPTGRYHIPRRTRFVADGRQVLRADDHAGVEAPAAAAAQVAADVRGLLPEAGVLVLAGQGLGGLTPDGVDGLIRAAALSGVRTVAAVRGDVPLYRGVSAAVVPWAAAAATYGHVAPGREGDPVAAAGLCRALVADTYAEHVVLDAGQYGLFWSERRADGRGSDPVRVLAHGRPVVDPTGAADALVGVLAAELCRGTETAEALVRANAAAGEAAARLGTVVVTRDEVEAALVRHPAGAHKVMTPDRLRAAAEVWRKIGRRVGCAVADFTAVGVEAVRFVAEAAAECDSLVVVVTDPIDPGDDGATPTLEARVEMLAALGYPSAVVAAPAGRDLAAVRAAHPDVLVVPQGRAHGRPADYVVSHGGRVVVSARTV